MIEFCLRTLTEAGCIFLRTRQLFCPFPLVYRFRNVVFVKNYFTFAFQFYIAYKHDIDGETVLAKLM